MTDSGWRRRLRYQEDAEYREKCKAYSRVQRINHGKDKDRKQYHHRQELEKQAKRELFNLLGNKCAKCGNDNPIVLCIHHTEKGNHLRGKSIHLHRVWQTYLKQLKAGIRIQLLCANCHLIEHLGTKRPTVTE